MRSFRDMAQSYAEFNLSDAWTWTHGTFSGVIQKMLVMQWENQ